MRTVRKALARWIVSAAALFLFLSSALAHAVLLESNPSLEGRVAGPEVAVKLRFNVRIDAGRSRLLLIRPNGSIEALEISKDAPADTLSANAKDLSAGAYRLRWQVLASDGHITRGEIPFTVLRS